MSFNFINLFFFLLLLSFLIFILIGLMKGIKFQKTQNKKYMQCIDLIKNKANTPLTIKDGLTIEEIKNIDDDVNINNLMEDLYKRYLTFQNKVNIKDNDFEDILHGNLKKTYINKINNYKLNEIEDVIDKIDLIGYSIQEFSEKKLKFRININCCCYKKSKDKIVSGTNLDKAEIIFLITYTKINEKWLISDIEKLYEKKL